MARDFAKQFYKSKAWERARAYVLMRDKYRCRMCGSASDLEVHHIVPLSPDTISQPFYATNEGNLMTLCTSCHMALHAAERSGASEILPTIVFDENGYPVEINDKRKNR